MSFEDLKGKILLSVVNNDDEELIFTTDEGTVYKLYHDQCCCESVTIEDIDGDLEDLIGSEIFHGIDDRYNGY